MQKNKYVLDLSSYSPHPANTKFTPPAAKDIDKLAQLMLDAFRGTIDDEGETLAEAKLEVQDYFNNHPLLDQSLVITDGHAPTSACLVTYMPKQDAPLIAYIMTTPSAKRSGQAKDLLRAVITHLKQAGYSRVLAGITDGNIASEQLFVRIGFEKLS